MAGKGLDDLGRPPRRYNLIGTPGFETLVQSEREDAIRARMLRLEAEGDLARTSALLEMANELDPSLNDDPQSCASSRHMRAERARILSWVWRVCDQITAANADSTDPTPDPTTFHVIPPTFSVPSGDLHTKHPRQLLKQFRRHLYGAGAADADGILFAALDGAFDPAPERYPLHIHGLASGGMIAVLDKLRETRTYKPAAPGDGPDRANTPIVVARAPLTNLPDPITYIMKSYWRLRETELGDDGVRRAVDSNVMRIPKPAHSEHLLWLSRWKAKDLILMMGLRVINKKLTVR